MSLPFYSFLADRYHVNHDTTPNQSPSEQTHDAPKRKSVWTPKQKLIRMIWGTLGRVLWVLFPFARVSILRAFGGSVGSNVEFARDVDIVVPWNIKIGNNVVIGNHTILYSLGVITIGDGCVLDTKAHLCAGTHDMTDPLFPLVRPPITLEPGCFVGFDAYIGPDVTLAKGTRVYPRTSVYRSTQPGTVWKGNPGKLVEDESSAPDQSGAHG